MPLTITILPFTITILPFAITILPFLSLFSFTFTGMIRSNSKYEQGTPVS